MTNLSVDVRDALRALRRNPTFSLVALLTMAIGIGANTAVFSVVNALLLRPLPYRDPDRLVWVAKLEPAMHAEIAAGADYLDWRDQTRSLEGIAAWDEAPALTLLGAGDPERLVGAHVTARFFDLLGVRPVRGRSFLPEDERLNGPPVAIVSHRLWERVFGADAAFRERPLRLDSGTFTVVGVLPASFLFPQKPSPDILMPLRLDEAMERRREMMRIVHVAARLKTGVAIEQVRSELTAIIRRGEQQAAARQDHEASAAAPPRDTESTASDTFDRPVGPPGGAPASGERIVRPPEGRGPMPFANPAPGPAAGGGNHLEMPVGPRNAPSNTGGPGGPNAGPRRPPQGEIIVRPLQQHLVGDVRPALMLLTATVGLVLLIACANVANLVLARATARSRELAVRAALGATRWRLVRQSLVESVLLALAGGALGVLAAGWCLGVVRSLLPAPLAEGALGLAPIGIDRGVLVFTVIVASLTGIVSGVGPALVASRVDLETSLREAARFAAGSAARSRLRRVLVVGEIALAVVLLVGAGLLVRSFARLLSVDPGFRSERVVTMAVNLQAPNADAARTRANPFFADVAARVRALPGVQAVAYGDTVPLRQYSRIMMGLAAEGRDDPAPNGPPPDVAVSMVSSQYFTAMGVRLVRGRAFTDDDRQGSPPVAVVNERFARQFWGAEDPVGRRLRFGPRRPDWITVVGVAADVRHDGLAAEPRRTLYQPFAQEPVPFGFIVVRTSGETASTVQAVRQVVRTIDPTLAVYDVATMDERLERSVGGRRFSMLLILAFALVALTLAAVGLYGVLAYIVGERTREIGIRMALGAGLQDVLGMVLRQSGVMVALGVVLGLMAALAVGPLLAAGLFGVTPHDPFTLVSVPLVIAAIAAIATWVPARRAARVDPVEALRDE
jgi:predicted permease